MKELKNMNILVITQMLSQPDDQGDNKPTKTVNYFIKEWVAMGNNVVAIHCSSKFPLLLYYTPKMITDIIVKKTSCIIPPKESRMPLEREENGALIYRIPLMKIIPGQAYSSRRMLKCSESIITKLKKIDFKPEVVIGHFANPSTELVSLISQYYSAKSSIVFHGDCTEKSIERYRLRNSIKNIGAVGARSVVEATEIKKLLDMEKQPFICCSGVPNEVVENASRICNKHNEENIKFLYVGSLIKRKHVDAVMIAFDEIHHLCEKGLELNIVGGGLEESTLKNKKETLFSKNKINFLGRLNREDVFKAMKEANIFTLISDNEVFGMVYIEAMLQGCIVIASKGGGFDGIIKDGINGFLCNPGDEKMLTKIYISILNMSSEERNQIGQNAIDTALHYSEFEVAERYLKDVLENQKKEKTNENTIC